MTASQLDEEDAPYRPPDVESHSDDDDEDLGDLTQEDLLGMSEVDRIKWQKAKEKQVQRDSAAKEKRPKKTKNKHVPPGTPEKHPNKTTEKQTPPPTEERQPKETTDKQTPPPTEERHPKKSKDVQTPPPIQEKHPKKTKNVQTPPPTQEKHPKNTKDIQIPKRGKVSIQVIYKGELPFPPPRPFNCVTTKRRRTEDDDDSGHASAKGAKTDEPYHDTRIDGVDFKTWNTSWLMRLSQLKGLPARPPHDVDNPATLHIALIDQLEDKEQEESVSSNAYGGSKRVAEPPIPLIDSKGNVYFNARIDIDTVTFSAFEKSIRIILARRGIELKEGQLRLYASTSEAYAPNAKSRFLKSGSDQRRAAVLRKHLDGEWKTVYVWKYGKEFLEREERRD